MPNCPRDGSKLEQTLYHGICLMKCPECHGVVLEQKDTRRLLDRLSKDLLLHITFDYPIDARPKDTTTVHCVYCKESMENYSFMEAGTVHLNCCRACQVLWADAEELGEMSLLYARTNRRREEQRLKEVAHRIDASNSAQGIDAMQAMERGIIIGMILGGLL